jgi:hypothetical protein
MSTVVNSTRRIAVQNPNAVTRRSSENRLLKEFAKEYIDIITRIHTDLKAKRAEYKRATSEIDKIRIKDEFDNIWLTQWPHYTDSSPHPVPNGTEPYPPFPIMKKFSLSKRKFIAKTALSAHIGAANRRRFEGLNHIIDATLDLIQLRNVIKKYLQPPNYPVYRDEIYEDEYYDDEGYELMEPDISRRTRRRHYGQARTPSPIREVAPAYYSPGNTPLRDSSSPPPRYSPGSRTAGGRNTFSNTFLKKVGKKYFLKKVGKNSRRTRRRRHA